jgi:GH15 family glucan-1,4-alpha-glucosidase
MDLLSNSIKVIQKNQHPSGAFIASPSFPTYHYCWLRDGSFIAHAMDVAGEFESAERYFNWVNKVINRYTGKVDLLEKKITTGDVVPPNDYLHTRYTLDGFEASHDENWGNFQIDGYGNWLWALGNHIRLTGRNSLLADFSDSINTTIRYLNIVWKLPNYDCWEEHPEFIHPYSLGAVYAGLKSIGDLIKEIPAWESPIPTEDLVDEIRDFVLRYAVVNSTFVKLIDPKGKNGNPEPVTESGVDASLLGIIYPYKLVSEDNQISRNTVEEIEKKLHRRNGGVYRYAKDEYYGGGEWLLLTAWLGWLWATQGNNEKAKEILKWIESTQDSLGNLPEQVSGHLLTPSHFQKWVDQWGNIASPLLWSHAMYILLKLEANRTL